jgi:predicted dehydrogenase
MRILIAGLGAIGQRHARNLRVLFGKELQLLAFRRRRLMHVVTDSLEMDRLRNVESELGITAYENLDEALAAGPAAVFVCTPSALHTDIAFRSASAGCHLFIEKPLSNGLDGVDELARIVVSKSLVATVGCQWRFHPYVRWLRDVLKRGELGKILSATIEYREYMPDWHPYEDYRNSYAGRLELGGGVVLTQIHDYDLAWWLFGAPRTVIAVGGHLSNLEIDVEDTVEAQLLGGAIPVTVRQCFASHSRCRLITVVGEQGVARVDLLHSKVTSSLGAPVNAFHDLSRNTMFLDEVRHFHACVTRHDEPIVPLQQGIEVLRLALAVKESMQSGRAIDLGRQE